MHVDTPSDLAILKTEIIDGMRSFMHSCKDDDSDAGYTEADIGQCAQIIDSFLQSVASVPAGNQEQMTLAVKQAVLALNVLNARCDHCLIETDQREGLCELIIRACSDAGLDAEDDITEMWREW
ncbi:hypothetical protein [Dyella tabacisoli]|uniref:Uncharacterized protein n=1 Tax=Dyella tabacisoli TaxID=2282381 RepID=A0A369UKJ4_9GAMM|nr:hypothetical protein [Dyella tabacisoli]RDD81061.1 hypothetical protein DVJ77_13965 [Dyella tabacisoli]